MNTFNLKTSSYCSKNFEDYRLLAGDGTDVNIYLNPNDKETYIPQHGKKGFNLLHVNTLYDLENQIYTDITISGKRKTSERRELNIMADRSELKEPTILILDRGYEGLNVFAHLIRDDFYFLNKT
ncbi:MAG: transposase [Treponema sp.]|nr:transposase [Treponema sp.]